MTFTFGSQGAAVGLGNAALSGTDVTITKVSGTGTVSVGEEVTVSGLTINIRDVSGISDGDRLTYQGDGVFNCEVGYVFTTSSVLTIPGTVLVVFDAVVSDFASLQAISFFSDGVTSQTLGTTPACFAEGTLIAAPEGEIAVEALRIGDPLLTADGRVIPVKWIGRQTVSTRFGPAERLMPVRLRAGALGPGIPARDLVLTADHALLLDGLLVNAGALVNGSSVDWVPLSELGNTYTVYHIETENHDLILAAGAAAETFIDYAGRQAFGNYGEYLARYGAERMIPEQTLPRVSSARLVPQAFKDRLSTLAHVA